MSKVGSTNNQDVFAVSESADNNPTLDRAPKTFGLFIWKNYV